MNKNYLWHVTDCKNVMNISLEGLIPNEGKIFLFDQKKYAAYIASHQCFLENFALFRIHGIDIEKLKPDNVAEFTAHSQWIYDLPISIENLKFMNCYKIILSKRKENICLYQ